MDDTALYAGVLRSIMKLGHARNRATGGPTGRDPALSGHSGRAALGLRPGLAV